MGLAEVKPTHANIILLSRLGCDLLPDMIFPDSIWVKVHQGLTPYEHTDQCLLAFIKGILFPVSGWLWEGQGGSLCWIIWAVPREEEHEEDRKSSE